MLDLVCFWETHWGAVYKAYQLIRATRPGEVNKIQAYAQPSGLCVGQPCAVESGVDIVLAA